MLCQLVCVDRRYQRMNCFNIREVQSLLKRKFFIDLINSKDHRELINETALGLRFKSEGSSSINSNVINFYFYGPDLDLKIRNVYYLFNPIEKDMSGALSYNHDSIFFNSLSYFNKSNIFSRLNYFLFLLTDGTHTAFNFTKQYDRVSFIIFKFFFIINRIYLYVKFLFLLVFHSLNTAFSYIYTIVDNFF
jgi:hypothetical protein